MKADLRDLFAVHFAAALVREQRHSIEFITGRAYDLADAMLAERERRLEAEPEAPAEAGWGPPAGVWNGGLLDDPGPPSERDLDPSWLEPAYDPAWDVEKWRVDPGPDPRVGDEQRPGLARTSVAPADDDKNRKMG